MNVIRSIIVLGVRGWNKRGRISFECRGGSRTAPTGAVTMEQAGSTVGAGSLFLKLNLCIQERELCLMPIRVNGSDLAGFI